MTKEEIQAALARARSIELEYRALAARSDELRAALAASSAERRHSRERAARHGGAKLSRRDLERRLQELEGQMAVLERVPVRRGLGSYQVSIVLLCVSAAMYLVGRHLIHAEARIAFAFSGIVAVAAVLLAFMGNDVEDHERQEALKALRAEAEMLRALGR